MENPTEITCPYCNSSVPAASFFCPKCGKKLRVMPQEANLSKQLAIYSISLFLPPFGFWYVWKYFRQGDPASKKIAITAAVLTVISIIFTVWFSIGIVSSINQTASALNGLY